MANLSIAVSKSPHAAPRMNARLTLIALAAMLAPLRATAQSAVRRRKRPPARPSRRSSRHRSSCRSRRCGRRGGRRWRPVAPTADSGVDLPARGPRGGYRRKVRRGLRQGRAAYAPRDRARGLAALRFPGRRDLGQGRRADPPRHRLDHRPRAALQARHRDRLLHVAPLLHRRERRTRQRCGNPFHRPRQVRSHRRALHDLRRAARRLVRPDGRASRSTRRG